MCAYKTHMRRTDGQTYVPYVSTAPERKGVRRRRRFGRQTTFWVTTPQKPKTRTDGTRDRIRILNTCRKRRRSLTGLYKVKMLNSASSDKTKLHS